ncbi:hypothetical protein BC826DRAFT_1107178 [Russula brevipes]|nr:hypothetical protein BC826DRAFT_1107178 [Russula brevipes]
MSKVLRSSLTKQLTPYPLTWIRDDQNATNLQSSQPGVIIRRWSWPGTTLMLTSESSKTGRWFLPDENEFWVQEGKGLYQCATIGMLPENALIEIFDFYRADSLASEDTIWNWHTLVHVCRTWRQVVFASCRRLGLRLVCTPGTPTKQMLDAWPVMPIVIRHYRSPMSSFVCADNIIAALEHQDRILEIILENLTSSLLQSLVTAMLEPFPSLTDVLLRSNDEAAPALPATFLGGFAPRLQIFQLSGIPFPALPRLLLSATDLVDLRLENIPDSGYIPPWEMITCLSTSPNLYLLRIEFRSPRACPDRRNRRPPPMSRAVLPALAWFFFKGVSEYFEDIVAQIDAPRLNHLTTTFFNQLVFEIPQFSQFIARAARLKSLSRAWVNFLDRDVSIAFTEPGRFDLHISSEKLDWQLSSLAQICSQFSSTGALANVEQLDLDGVDDSQPPDCDDQNHQIDSAQWFELFRPFTVVNMLRMSPQLEPLILPALTKLAGESVAELLPVLQTILLAGRYPFGPARESMEALLLRASSQVSLWLSAPGQKMWDSDSGQDSSGRRAPDGIMTRRPAIDTCSLLIRANVL